MKSVINAKTLDTEKFDVKKIHEAIKRDVSRYSKSLTNYEISQIVLKVEDQLNLLDSKYIWSSQIRDMVVSEAINRGINGAENWASIGIPFCDLDDLMSGKSDLTRENANLPDSHESRHKHIADLIMKQYMLRVIPKNVRKMHACGDIHIHDMEYPDRIFCFDTDLRAILYKGLVPDGIGKQYPAAGPAKHAEVAFLHAAKSLGCSQSECAGGQGFAYFNVFLAPYIQNLPPNRIKQLAQMFVYEMGQMMVARGGQAVFSSIQLWPTCPSIFENSPVVWKGVIDKNLCYGDLKREIYELGKAFLEVFLEGDSRGRPFSFPKPEVVITKEFWNDQQYKEFYEIALAASLKNGSPYYELITHSNIVECYQCCAYSFSDDKPAANKLNFEGDLFNNLGSIQVVSINMPRIAYRMKKDDPSKFVEIVDNMLQNIMEFFVWKKSIIGKTKFPYLNQDINGAPLANINELPFIIGIVGLNEFVEYLTGKNIVERPEVAERYLGTLNMRIGHFAHKYNLKVALARTPAETTAGRFAKLDEIYYEESKRVLKGTKTKYYTNGAMVPDNAPITLNKKIEIESRFWRILQSNIFHIFTSEVSPFIILDDLITTENIERLREIFNEVMGAGIKYWAVTRDLSVCNDCNKVMGALIDKCIKCGSKNIEQFSRITGYIQAISGWNDAKIEELRNRRKYEIIRLESPIESSENNKN